MQTLAIGRGSGTHLPSARNRHTFVTGRAFPVLGAALCLMTAIACGGPTATVPPTTALVQPPVSPTASPVGRASPPPIPTQSTTPPQTDNLDNLISQMTTDEKIGQLFMVSFYGDQTDETDPTQVAANETLLGEQTVAQAIASAHGGHISVGSCRPAGMVFTLGVPLA